MMTGSEGGEKGSVGSFNHHYVGETKKRSEIELSPLSVIIKSYECEKK